MVRRPLLCLLPYIFQATLFSTHPSHKPLTHPVNNPKRNQIFRLSIQTGCHLSIQEPTLEVPYSKSSDYIVPVQFKNYYIHQNQLSHNNNPHAPHTYAERSSNIPFIGWIRQRYSNTISVSCPPRLDCEMLSSRSGIQPNQLNMNILILMFLWPFLAMVLLNVFLWPVSATQVV